MQAGGGSWAAGPSENQGGQTGNFDVLNHSIHILHRSSDVLFKSECNYSHANCKNRFMVLEIIYIFLDGSAVGEVYWVVLRLRLSGVNYCLQV